jgi:large subunit ribosomal protein L24e
MVRSDQYDDILTLKLTESAMSVEGRDRLVLRLPDLPLEGPPLCPGRQQGTTAALLEIEESCSCNPVQIFRFSTSKSESLFLQRKNPRKIAWTVVYRRMHKKGITEEVAKKRSRKTVKHQRGIVGADLATIAARRNQSAQARAAQRTSAIQKAKAEKKAKEDKKDKTKVRSQSTHSGCARIHLGTVPDCWPGTNHGSQDVEGADEGFQGWPLNPFILLAFGVYCMFHVIDFASRRTKCMVCMHFLPGLALA